MISAYAYLYEVQIEALYEIEGSKNTYLVLEPIALLDTDIEAIALASSVFTIEPN